jgi:DNA (cytosine-5)-methyltransferase 1
MSKQGGGISAGMLRYHQIITETAVSVHETGPRHFGPIHPIQKQQMELQQLIQEVKPEGSEDEAVISQWVHAYNGDFKFFGQSRKITPAKIKKALTCAGILKADGKISPEAKKKYRVKSGKTPKFKFIDLFAGIGGMRLGFQAAGGTCVFSSEFEKNAQQTYFENHGDFPFGDITKIHASDIPDHDILLAGFPCQPFSHAGLKLGIADTRGTLFHDIANILDKKKPKVALLENVKGLLSHDKGFTWQTILKTMVKLGYRCNIENEIILNGTPRQLQEAAKHMVLKSIDFGIPQNRQRIFIVLWRAKNISRFEYPRPLCKETRVGDILEAHPDSKYTISDKLWLGHKKRKEQNKIDGKGFGFGLVSADSKYTNTISARYYKDGSEILVSQEGLNPRKITPREAARLQGFPDDFVLNKSSVHVYKQYGNSVTVNVVSAVANEIRSQILED